MTDTTSESGSMNQIIDLSAYDPELARMARVRDSYEDNHREHIAHHTDRIDASLQAIEGAFRRLIASGADISEEATNLANAGRSIQLIAGAMMLAAKRECV